MELLPLVIQLIAGAIGGNAAGAVLKDKSLGALGNTIAGIIGGAVGGKLLGLLLGGAAAVDPAVVSGMNFTALIEQIAGGGIGGAVVVVLVGLVKGINKS